MVHLWPVQEKQTHLYTTSVVYPTKGCWTSKRKHKLKMCAFAFNCNVVDCRPGGTCWQASAILTLSLLKDHVPVSFNQPRAHRMRHHGNRWGETGALGVINQLTGVISEGYWHEVGGGMGYKISSINTILKKKWKRGRET